MDLTSRELSLVIWSGAIVVWALSVSAVRKSLGPMIRSLMTPALGLPLVMMLGYVGAVVAGLHRAGWWQPGDTKDTILWIVGFAVVTFFETPEISRDPSRLKRVVAEVLSLAVVIEFVMNLFVMRLLFELLLVPVMAMVAMLLVLAEQRKEHAEAARLLRLAQSSIGFCLAAYVAFQLVTRFGEIATIGTAREFALPILLSFLFLPFQYLMALYAGYDGVLRRLGWLIRDRVVRRYARRRTTFSVM